jgi:hypothetical protein
MTDADREAARPPVWKALRLAHAALDDPETCPRERAVAQAMIGAAAVAVLPFIEDTAADLADAVGDESLTRDMRRDCWRCLSEEHRAQRRLRRAIARSAAPFLIVGGNAA